MASREFVVARVMTVSDILIKQKSQNNASINT